MIHPFMSRLKDSIQDLHDAAQETRPLDAILNRSITRDEYRAVLERFYGIVIPFEAFIAANIGGFDLGQPYAEIARRPDLERDLLFFGADAEYIAALPLAEVDARPDLPTALGLLYLMEGSRLGGLVIARSLQESLHVDPCHGAAYFSSRGKDPHMLNDELRNRLESWVTRTGKGDAVISAAREGFSLMNAWMDQSQNSA
ncbi:biliverdin-producing heme oxygenase [Oceanidesulfovibrio marinus]|uniref:Biliverdin-producing heme oxygenase n=1 Tax=Oceanidesulfovibrio marinus TaxID=370038 RepID=A0ABX6NGQ4_9BACT|nr:biliverdin-producing heme oxygenase [Oceanidesulfovibrio marinus]QJT08937.1 biliverdin-producing heme oxygenase [Oceanidesulfovibrio marinus]